jgi:ABC-type branched-subunit amino acid transport system substrate-binding protein
MLSGLLLGMVLGLAACAPQPPRPAFIGAAPPIAGAPGQPVVAVPRAGVLLPLTGPQAPLGQAMLNASTMAMFDEAPRGVELAPRDTGGTPAGAANAARAAIADGARVLIGPLTSLETAAVAEAARGTGVPVLAFTNDPQRAQPGVWVLGMTPTQQVRRVTSAAARQGAQRFGLAAPDTEFGRALATALRSATTDLGLPPPVIVLHPAAADPGMAAGGARTQMARVDALILGEAGDRARRFLAGWLADAPSGPPPRLLGTALWLGDATVAAEPGLEGAWFPGPDGRTRARFESRYRDAFNETPPRVAASAYDAAALGVRALAAGSNDPTASTAAEAYIGADGPVRLVQGGQTLRGLAIYAVSPDGQPREVEPAVAPGGPGS